MDITEIDRAVELLTSPRGERYAAAKRAFLVLLLVSLVALSGMFVLFAPPSLRPPATPIGITIITTTPTHTAFPTASSTPSATMTKTPTLAATQTATAVLPSPTLIPAPPTPTPAVAKLIANQNVNVRDGPGTNYKQIGELSAGQTVEVTGKNPSGTWYQIDFNGQPGWVVGVLVTVSGDADEIQVAQNIPAPPLTALPPPPVSSQTITHTPTTMATSTTAGTPIPTVTRTRTSIRTETATSTLTATQTATPTATSTPTAPPNPTSAPIPRPTPAPPSTTLAKVGFWPVTSPIGIEVPYDLLFGGLVAIGMLGAISAMGLVILAVLMWQHNRREAEQWSLVWGGLGLQDDSSWWQGRIRHSPGSWRYEATPQISGRRRRLMAELARWQALYDQLTDRIKALDADISIAQDHEHMLTLGWRRDDLIAARERIIERITPIEEQLDR